MNGRTDLIEHIEHCAKCQEREARMEVCESKVADKLQMEIELCLIESQLEYYENEDEKKQNEN